MAKNNDAVALVDEAWPLRQARLFFLAVQFFTRLPIPRWVGFREEWLGQTARFFPMVGWILGACCAAIFWGAAYVLPAVPALLFASIAGVMLTGALHEDGFADVCDGFGGGTTRERILDIMRDSRIGAYGALGIVLLLAMRMSCLASLPRSAVVAVLMAAHPLSRTMAAALMWRLDYARSEGKAAPLAKRMSAGEFLFAVLCGICPLAALVYANLLPWQAAAAGAGLALLSMLYLTRLFVKRIGGYTGDCLGAVQQLSEVGFYLGAASCYFYLRPGA